MSHMSVYKIISIVLSDTSYRVYLFKKKKKKS